MKYVKTAAFLLIMLLLQTTFFRILFGAVSPNLMLCTAICYAMRENDYLRSAYFGVACGVLLDYTSGALFGVATLLCTVCCALVTWISPHVFKAKLAANLLFLFLVSVVYTFLYYVLCFGLWQASDYLGVFIGKVLPSAVFNTVAGALILPWVKKLAAAFSENN